MKLPPLSAEQRRRIAGFAESYQRLTNEPLVDRTEDLLDDLWLAPMAVVAHGTEADPIFFFGNAQALRLFELDFDAFTRLPSRQSAEPMLREERASLLERVGRDGIIRDYGGVRISATGRRFRIENASVWNLADDAGAPAGQAAAFATWTYL